MMFTKKESDCEVMLQGGGGFCYTGPNETGDRIFYWEFKDDHCNKKPWTPGDIYGDWVIFTN